MNKKQNTTEKTRCFDILKGGFALSFPPINGGMVCTRGDKTKWTFRTLTDIKGNTRYHIGYVDKHSDAWHEVTKATFHNVQKKLRGRLMPNAGADAPRTK